MVAGAAVFPPTVLAVALFVYSQSRFPPFLGEIFGIWVLSLIFVVPAGACLGYLAGCVVAGIFFVQESHRRHSHPPMEIELLPFTAADFDTLISWVRRSQLFDLWSKGEFRYPLDHDQLAARLGLAEGESPALLCFKAVCGEMQEMVAYVELADIDRAKPRENVAPGEVLVILAEELQMDRQKPRASIQRAIVDPAREDRNHLSDVLVGKIVEQGFQQQNLQCLDTRLHREEVQALECFRKHGFLHGASREAWRDVGRVLQAAHRPPAPSTEKGCLTLHRDKEVLEERRGNEFPAETEGERPLPASLAPLECPVPGVAGVPWRFGAGTLLVLVTVFAVLFATMRTLGVAPAAFAAVAVLFLGVTLAQVLLFQGKKPRAASLLAGAVIFPLEMLALAAWFSQEGISIRFEGLGALYCGVAGGAFLGYVAGGVMAGVFFVAERIRRRSSPPVKIALVPFAAADFDTLISWVQSPLRFDRWSRGRFHYPLDHDQLAARLGRTAGEPPVFLCLKGVYGETEQMVAYAELTDIDREKLRASIELAIVDPSQSERGHLSDALVREIVQCAFQSQGLQWLIAEIDCHEVQSLACFLKHGFHDAPAKERGEKPVRCGRLVRSKWG